MKRLLTGVVLIACALPLIGWGNTYENKNDNNPKKINARDKTETREHHMGEVEADKDRQGNDEDIKRAQGDESGLRDIHRQGALQNDDQGRF